MDKEQIVLSVYFVKVRPLIPKSRVPCIADRQTVQPARKGRRQSGIELCDIDILAPVCDVRVVPVKQEGTVVVKALDLMLFPRSRDRA